MQCGVYLLLIFFTWFALNPPVPLLLILHPCFSTAGDISGAVQTLRSLLLFYPSDKDSLDNLQLYSETLGGDTESQGTQPAQVPLNGHYTKITAVVVII